MSASPLVLVDGSSYLYRAFPRAAAVVDGKRASRPTPCSASSTCSTSCSTSVKPTRMAVVFDAPGKTFRDDLYAEYKANRPPMPDELRAQVPPLLEAIEAMGIPLLRIEGVEADDVIGTLARQAAAAGAPTVISTGDKDLAQLVDGHVTLVNTMDNTKLDRAGVEQKFGVYARADHRLSGARRRFDRQHPRRTRRRPEDGGEMAAAIPRSRHAEGAGRRGRRQDRRAPARIARHARLVEAARDDPLRRRAAAEARRARAAAAGRGAPRRACSSGSSSRACCGAFATATTPAPRRRGAAAAPAPRRPKARRSRGPPAATRPS